MPVRPQPSPDWPEREVHVWRFPLVLPEGLLAELEPTLSGDEVTRADRFRGADLRARFVAGRGVLRRILASYLGAGPADLRFVYGLHGKPVLAGPWRVEFNLAHSGGMALCAVASGRPVGVDVEALRPLDNAERIIDRYFTPREQEEFLAHPSEKRLAAFYRGWTRKEAFLKVTGEGLSASLDSFEVSLRPDTGEHASLLLRVGEDRHAARTWTLTDVDAGPGFAAAIAVAGGPVPVVVRDWEASDRPGFRAGIGSGTGDTSDAGEAR